MKLAIQCLSALIVAFFVLSASGCVTQRDVRHLQADVAALKQQVETAVTDSTTALRAANAVQDDLAEVKKLTASASTDSSETRRLLEQMNARLDKVYGSQSYK